LGLNKQYGKKGSEVSHFLKKIFGLSILPPAKVSDWFALDCRSSLSKDKRVEEFCNYLIGNYIEANSIFFRLFGPNVLHFHGGQWTHVSHSLPISTEYFTVHIVIFLFLYLHCKKNTEWDLHQNGKRHYTKT
jgi:hypothetical protein